MADAFNSFFYCINLVNLLIPKSLKYFDSTSINGWRLNQTICFEANTDMTIISKIKQILEENLKIKSDQAIPFQEDLVVIKSSFESIIEAKIMAQFLTDKKLVFSREIQKMESVYRWDGELCNEHEVVLWCVTDRAHYNDAKQCLVARHSYGVCQLWTIPLVGYTDAYKNSVLRELNE